MTGEQSSLWLSSMRATVVSYRQMIDALTEQLADTELVARPAPGINSVAIVLRHLGGNLRSRWTEFLTTDGEKPNRDRDSEFLDWSGDRQSLMDHFERGWRSFEQALDAINDGNVDQTILMRRTPHGRPGGRTLCNTFDISCWSDRYYRPYGSPWRVALANGCSECIGIAQ